MYSITYELVILNEVDRIMLENNKYFEEIKHNLDTLNKHILT